MTDLDEFLELEYDNGKVRELSKDINVKDYIVLRLDSGGGCTIHYLDQGVYLHIPFPWDSLSEEFYKYCGKKVLEYIRHPESNYLTEFTFYLAKLGLYISESFSRIDCNDFLDTISKLCSLGTKEFIKQKPDLKLKPFELYTINDIIEI